MRNTDINGDRIMAELIDLQNRLAELERIEAEQLRLEQLTAAAYGLNLSSPDRKGDSRLISSASTIK